MRIVVYTAIVEGPNPEDMPWVLKQPTFVNEDVEYICFTDRDEEPMSPWQIRPVPYARYPRLESRRLKLRPHACLPDHDWSLWLDSRFTLHVDPVGIVEELEDLGGELGALRHPDRNNIIEEAEAIKEHCRALPALVDAQLEYYLAQGFGRDMGNLTSTGGLLLRRNSPRVRRFNRAWFREVERWTMRDQMSLDYAAKLAGLEVTYLAGCYRDNPYSTWSKL